MAQQILLIAALVAIARASVLEAPLIQPVPVVAKAVIAESYDPNPQYSYGYDVQDPLTGDSHGQVETRSGDIVQGSYNLLEADGTRRVVDYVADPINGFQAVVSKQPAVVAVPAVAKLAPVAVPVPAPEPVVRSAPLAPVVSSAPWAGPSVVRSAVPVAPWQADPVLRSAPLW